MSALQKRQRPATARRGFRTNCDYGTKPTATKLPRNWRERLPDPLSYYSVRVEKLGSPNASGWAQGRCPLHDDSNASLSVNVTDARGGWRCFAGCGGGDLLGFHMRLYDLAFC